MFASTGVRFRASRPCGRGAFRVAGQNTLRGRRCAGFARPSVLVRPACRLGVADLVERRPQITSGEGELLQQMRQEAGPRQVDVTAALDGASAVYEPEIIWTG